LPKGAKKFEFLYIRSPSGRRSEAIGIGCGREDKPEPPIQLRKLLPRSLFHPLMDLFFLLAIRADEKEVLWDLLKYDKYLSFC